MTVNTTTQRRPSAGRARLPILIAALLLVVSMTFIGSALTGTAQAQAERGAIPSLNLASDEPGQLVITWETPDPHPTDYRLSWAHSSLGFLSYKYSNEAERANVHPDGGATSLTLNNLTPGQDYKVQMRSRYYNADRSVHESSGPWTSTATQRVKDHPPAAPTGLTATQVGHDSLTLTWVDPQDASITGYRVLRGTDAGNLSTIEADTGNASTEYRDSTVAAETTYFYAVMAMSADGDGAQSTALSVTTPAAPRPEAPPPAEPTGLTAAQVGHDSLTLTWNDPQNARIIGYRILRGPDADSLSTIEPDTESASTGYTDDTVVAETTYFYAVTALRDDGYGAQSTAVSATTPPPPAIAMVVPSDALTDGMTQLEVNLTNLPAGRYNVRVTVTTDDDEEVAAHDAVVVVSEPPQSSQQQATESDDALLPTDSLGLVTVSPGTPTATQDGAEVLISWTAGVGNVELYYLARGLITGCQSGCWEVISTDGPVTSYRDLGVAPGRTYRYRVQAKYANTRSHFSAFTSITTAAVAEGVPMPPSGLTVRYDAHTAAIVLSWTAPDPASDVRNYRFNRCSFTSPMSSEDISCGEFLTGSTDTAYSDTTVEPGHHYIYNRLRAVGDDGDSYRTGWDRISVPAAGTLTAPTGLTAVHDENAGTATLSWTAPDPSTGLVDYRVLRCRFRLRNEADCTRILTGSTATTYTDTAVSGIRWSGVWYGVKAVTDVGDSFARYVYLRIE